MSKESFTTSPEAELWFATELERSKRGTFADVYDLTPDRSRVLLARNNSNRPTSHSRIALLMHDIKSQKFRLNGESIIISQDGLMNDGQHRCYAVAMADQTIQTVIAWGVERSSRTTVDTGGKRTVANMIAMEGGEHAASFATVARMLIQWQRFRRINNWAHEAPSSADQQEVYWDRYDEILAAWELLPNRGISRIGARTFAAFITVLLTRADKVKGPRFMMSLINGIDDGKPLPIDGSVFHLREKMGDPAVRRWTADERIELIVRHWNAHLRNRSMGRHFALRKEIPEIAS